MNRYSVFFLKAVLIACVMAFVGGCTSGLMLQYDKPPFKDMNKGVLNVVIDDQRPPEQGGDEPLRVGTIRNAFGMPFSLNASEEREPSKVIKELVTDCLKASGYKVAEKPGSMPQMHVVLKTFWSDGYQHSRAWTSIPVALKKDGQSKPVWEHTFEANTGATWTVGAGPIEEAIDFMLEEVKAKMLIEFKSKKFNKGVRSL
jgi:hypothetical protein